MQLGIHGYARNLRDGRVEVVAEGKPESLAELEKWLRHGPADARVEAVERVDVEEQSLSGFYTR